MLVLSLMLYNNNLFRRAKREPTAMQALLYVKQLTASVFYCTGEISNPGHHAVIKGLATLR
jgi:hypothetical protein